MTRPSEELFGIFFVIGTWILKKRRNEKEKKKRKRERKEKKKRRKERDLLFDALLLIL
jgi:hypothetical protein